MLQSWQKNTICETVVQVEAGQEAGQGEPLGQFLGRPVEINVLFECLSQLRVTFILKNYSV
jgi:hypothetical protein